MVAAPETFQPNSHAAASPSQGQHAPQPVDSIKQQRDAGAPQGQQSPQAHSGDRQGAFHSPFKPLGTPTEPCDATRVEATWPARKELGGLPLASGAQRTFPARRARLWMGSDAAQNVKEACEGRREASWAASHAGGGPAGEAHGAGRDEGKEAQDASGAFGARPRAS